MTEKEHAKSLIEKLIPLMYCYIGSGMLLTKEIHMMLLL